MTQEDKKLLLKDLCTRLPYGIKASYYGAEEEYETWDEIESITSDGYVDIGQYNLPIEDVKPYLFPLSSMTEEQRTSYNFLKHSAYANPIKLIDWYNKNHFDYRDLIYMGLAIDATGLGIY